MGNSIFANVILYDEIGPNYDGNSVALKGLGGSEFQSILLLEEIAKLGKSVVCLNNSKSVTKINGVLYAPNYSVREFSFSCDNLIIHRYSNFPNIPSKHVFMWATDLNGVHNLKFYDAFEQKKLKLVCLSKFQADLFPEHWDKSVVNFIIPDWVYEYAVPTQKKDYIYASALLKGYNVTLELWKYLKLKGMLQGKSLNVCLPGYDNMIPPDVVELGVKYLGSLPFKQVVEEVAKSEGMFYVNTLPETFCISAVLAEILQTPTLVCAPNGLGALPEVLNSKTLTTDMYKFIEFFKKDKIVACYPKDYRAAIVMQKWKELLGF